MACATFRPEQRLHRAEEFAAVFSYRKVIRGAWFDLHWLPKSSDSPALTLARIGLVVPKRLVKRAVKRNLIKRLAREVFRHRAETLAGYDLVLKLGRKPDLEKDRSTCNQALRADMDAVINRLLQRSSPRA